MSFMDVMAFLPSQASFFTTFLNVVGVSKIMPPVIQFCSTQPLLVSVEFHGDHKTVYKDDVKSDQTQFGKYCQI